MYVCLSSYLVAVGWDRQLNVFQVGSLEYTYIEQYELVSLLVWFGMTHYCSWNEVQTKLL